MKEVEIKFRVYSFENIREKLLGLGFEMKANDMEETLFFDNESDSFVSKDITVRIKKGTDWASFAVKVKQYDDNYKLADEYQTDISDTKAMKGALEVLGLRERFKYFKQREHWIKESSSVELDYIPEIDGYFVEVEAESGGEIESLASQLGLIGAERDKRSYPDIVKEYRK